MLPPKHPVYGMLLGDMAGFYRKLDEKDIALQYGEEAREVARCTIPTHPLALELYRELGREYEQRQDFKKAEQLYAEIVGFLSKRNSTSSVEPKATFESALQRVRAQMQTARP